MNAFGSALVMLLLQWTLLLALGWCVHALCLRRHPRWRLILWRMVLLGAVILPVMRMLPLPRLSMPQPRVVLTADSFLEPSVAPIPPSQSVAPRETPIAPTQAATTLPASAHAVPVTGPMRLPWKHLLVALWAIGFGWDLTRLLRRKLDLRAVLKRAVPASAPVQTLAQRIQHELGIRRDVRVRVSDTVASPFLCGVVAPVIVLPQALADSLSAAQIEALLSHELAHQRRHDLAWCLGWRLMRAIFWFHPLVWRIPAAHTLACEEEADRIAASRVKAREHDYAQLLAQMTLQVMRIPLVETELALNATSHIARRLIQLGRARANAWHWKHSMMGFAVAAVLFLLTAGWQFGQNSAADPTQHPDAATAQPRQLKVIVVDSITQQPVVGAEVSTLGREPTKMTTDVSGMAVLPVRANLIAPEKDTMFSFAVKSPEHEPRQIEWFSDAGRVRDTLPTEYKVALRQGGIAGGVVQDERGAPISGARIVGYASGLRSRSLGRGDKLQQEYGFISVTEAEAVVSDENGKWRLQHFPTEITQISIDVIRPEGARTRFISGSMYRGPNERGGVVDVAQLLQQASVFTLKDGVTVRGIVVDEQNRPVGGAQLRARDAASRNQPYTFINNPDGTFTLPHWDVSSVLVTAEKEGYQAKSATIAAGGDAGVGRLVLAPAKPLVLRVVGENDAPIAGAELQSDVNPSPEQIVTWKARTDVNGRAEWPTAPDKPVTIWISPPPDSTYPFRSVRLVADGSEHLVRVRRGADKMIRVRFRVVDTETGATVPKFEVWRRLANQPFKPWGDPAEQGEFAREMAVGELPNGFVPSYRLQVRAAGYTGWSSDTLDYSFGDQEFTIKMVKGESTLANEPPPTRSAGAGIDGERDPQLLVLAGAIARLLETGDVDAFVKATNTSLDDWKRLLPPGAGEKDLPLGPDPMRIIQHREQAIAASATHVIEIARRAGVFPGKVRFTVKSVSSPMNSSSGFKIAGQSMMMSFAMAVRVVLAGVPVGGGEGTLLGGDYELSVGNVRKFPSGWRTEEGVRWAGFPERVGDKTIRRELALANRIASTSFADQRTLSGMDDSALLQFGAIVTDLVRQRDSATFVRATRLSRDETAEFYVRTGRAVTPEMDEAYARNSTGLAAAAGAMIALQERMGIDLSDAKLTVKQVLAARPYFMRFGQVDGIGANSLRVTFAAESNRIGKSGQPVAGNYTVAIGNVMRVDNRWVLVEDKIRFQEFPKGLVTDEDLKHLELENYIAEHRTLPPGHAAPEISFIKLADNASMPLSAYRGKVVVLEFWAVWCGPCQEPMEKLQHLRDAHPEWKDRVEIIALSIDEKPDEPRGHLEKKGWSKTFNVWAGEGGWQAPPVQAFRVRGVPTAYVLSRDGRVVTAGHPASMDFDRIVSEELKKSSQ